MKKVEITGPKLLLVDLSHHNDVVDYQKLKDNGVVGAYCKATQGDSFQDHTFKTHVDGCHAVGIMVGAYHFLETNDSVQGQIANFTSMIGQVKDKLSLIHDVDWEVEKFKHDKENELAWDMVCAVRDLMGKYPIVYTGNWFADQIGGMDQKFSACILWGSDYSLPTCNVPEPWAQVLTNAPGTPWVWQYTETGSLPNYPGKHFDLNWFNGDMDKFKATMML